MFKCEDCRKVFDEAHVWQERHGLDTPPYETLAGCPHCLGHFEEAYQCEICGEWFAILELHGDVCDECIGEYTSYTNCKDVFDGETATVNIDYLASVLLDEATINAILREYLQNRLPHADCTEAIEADKTWFAEKLVKTMKGDK